MAQFAIHFSTFSTYFYRILNLVVDMIWNSSTLVAALFRFMISVPVVVLVFWAILKVVRS